MKTLTLSGWTQPADALAATLELPDAAIFDYSEYVSPEASFEGLRAFADAENVIGWSMGGQLAIQAIAAGILSPRRLTLLGTPYQFVSGQGFAGGMDPITYKQFRTSYAKDAARTMQRFALLMGKGDRAADRVASLLSHHHEVANTSRWLPWLDSLGAYSLRDTDVSMFPPTLIVHGEGDAIAPIAQAEMLAKKLPHTRLERWEEAGHAPHLHDRLRFRESITRHHTS